MMLKQLWRDDAGALVATEYLLLASVLVIGSVAGLASLRNAVNAEYAELANSILGMSQGYTIPGQKGCGLVEGSQVQDLPGRVPCPQGTSATMPVVLGCDTPTQ